MPPPSEAAETDALWMMLTKMSRPSKVVDFPRKDPVADTSVGQIRMRPLTQEEQMVCNAEADRYTKALLKEEAKLGTPSFGYQHTFGSDCGLQILFRACRQVDDDKKAFFPSPALMRRTLTVDELTELFDLYVMVTTELGPYAGNLDQESEPEELVEELTA